MQRVTTITVALTFVLAIALIGVLVKTPTQRPAKAVSSAKPDSSAEKAAEAPPAPPASAEFADLLAPVMVSNPDAGFDLLPDGSKVPPLPDTAPQAVRFGVIQFAYQGAQFAGDVGRTKEQAKQRAQAVVEEAKKDFAAAVARGDQGSRADAGKIPRGILEPAAEYVLFTLGKGEVSSQAVETPRGFWIVRRND
jgi:hypothetical protein